MNIKTLSHKKNIIDEHIEVLPKNLSLVSDYLQYSIFLLNDNLNSQENITFYDF